MRVFRRTLPPLSTIVLGILVGLGLAFLKKRFFRASSTFDIVLLVILASLIMSGICCGMYLVKQGWGEDDKNDK